MALSGEAFGDYHPAALSGFSGTPQGETAQLSGLAFPYDEASQAGFMHLPKNDTPRPPQGSVEELKRDKATTEEMAAQLSLHGGILADRLARAGLSAEAIKGVNGRQSQRLDTLLAEQEALQRQIDIATKTNAP